MTKRPNAQMELVRRSPADTSKDPTKRAAADLFPDDVRLNVGVPEAVRFAAKRRAMDQRLTLRAYILRLLAKDGIKEAE